MFDGPRVNTRTNTQQSAIPNAFTVYNNITKLYKINEPLSNSLIPVHDRSAEDKTDEQRGLSGWWPSSADSVWWPICPRFSKCRAPDVRCIGTTALTRHGWRKTKACSSNVPSYSIGNLVMYMRCYRKCLLVGSRTVRICHHVIHLLYCYVLIIHADVIIMKLEFPVFLRMCFDYINNCQ